ncbi:MAG: hypothetical protein ACXAE3_13270, partial [Candidatus Kariarchaeaceae archaeon]
MGSGFVFDGITSPYDIVNGVIAIGKAKYLTIHTDDESLLQQIQEELNLDNLDTESVTLNEYRQAIDTLILDPALYFEVGTKIGMIGSQLTIKDHDRLRISYELYETYKDPRVRDDRITQAGILYDSILRQAKIVSRNEQSPTFDIPKLQWQRTKEDQDMFSIVFLKTVFNILKKGWMINPELIRILNVMDEDILDQVALDLSIFAKSRITISFQRLSDMIFLDNFGVIDQEVQSNLLDDMFSTPIEDRGNLPQSEAKEVVNFLNVLRSKFREFDELTRLSRYIGVLTKPIGDT